MARQPIFCRRACLLAAQEVASEASEGTRRAASMRLRENMAYGMPDYALRSTRELHADDGALMPRDVVIRRVLCRVVAQRLLLCARGASALMRLRVAAPRRCLRTAVLARSMRHFDARDARHVEREAR